MCRGSCVEGCALCCNCGPCRRKVGLPPTGPLIVEARKKGFDNVHDYLVHQNTSQTPEELKQQKLSFQWSEWMRKGKQKGTHKLIAEKQLTTPKAVVQSKARSNLSICRDHRN